MTLEEKIAETERLSKPLHDAHDILTKGGYEFHYGAKEFKTPWPPRKPSPEEEAAQWLLINTGWTMIGFTL